MKKNKYLIFERLNEFSFILKVTFLLISYSFLVNYIFRFFDEYYAANEIDKIPLKSLLTLVLIVGPLIETFFFQFIILEIAFLIGKYINRAGYKKKFYSFLIIISAFLFGISHSYNLFYFLETFGGGIILAYSYLYVKLNFKSSFFLKPYLYIFLVHSFKNLTTFIYNLYFNY